MRSTLACVLGLLPGLLPIWGCSTPSADEGIGTESETGQPGDGDGDGDASEACLGGGPTVGNMIIEADTWPRTQDAVTGLDEATLDAECTIVGGTPTSLSMVCDDPEGEQHSVTARWQGPLFSVAGISKMRVRWILDTWHDVTMDGNGEWVKLVDAQTGQLIAASMSGHAEFLGLLPKDGVADDWYAPLGVVASYGVCEQDADAIMVTPLEGPPVYVAAPGKATIVDGDVSYELRISAFSSEDQGPENPSVSTFALVVYRM